MATRATSRATRYLGMSKLTRSGRPDRVHGFVPGAWAGPANQAVPDDQRSQGLSGLGPSGEVASPRLHNLTRRAASFEDFTAEPHLDKIGRDYPVTSMETGGPMREWVPFAVFRMRSRKE